MLDNDGKEQQVKRKTHKKLVVKSISTVPGPVALTYWCRITDPGKYVRSIITSLETACEHWNSGIASSPAMELAGERLQNARKCGARLKIVDVPIDEEKEK